MTTNQVPGAHIGTVLAAKLATAVITIVSDAIPSIDDLAERSAAMRFAHRLLNLIIAAEQGELPAAT